MTYTGNRINNITDIYYKERGGTLIGIVSGLLVGLAIALAVAIYVTKVPVPFLQKVTPAATPKPEEEAKKNSTWDPNAPLYGKHPAGTKPPPDTGTDAGLNPNAPPPPPGAAANTTTATVPAQNAPRTAAEKARAAAEAADNATNDPIAQIAKATQAKPPAKAPVTAAAPGAVQAEPPVSKPGDPWLYYLQAGAFRDQTQAEAQRGKLALSGQEAKITEREQAGSPIYRVRMGPFNTLDEVNRAKGKLDAQGVEGAVVRVPRP